MKIELISVKELMEYLIIKMLPSNSIVRYLYYVNNGTSTKNSQFNYLLDRQEFFNLKIV